MNKTKLTFVVMLLCLFSGGITAQIVGTDGFLMAPGLEIGLHEDGYEGSDVLPPFPTHYRGWTGRLGFLANPQNDGWGDYDGDYFMPGSPEGRFGIKTGGVTYFNSSAMGSSISSAGLSNYQVIGKCKFIDWDGSVSGIDIHMTYKLDTTKYYYTVQVVLTNTTVTDKPDVYFYKSLDPDNNMDIGWGFATVNTIEYQSEPDCPKSLVSATDNNGWESYIGLGALGEDTKVSYGGFFVDDPEAVWNGTFPYVGTMGSSLFSDQAIAISHKDDMLAAGESSSFEFVVVLDEAQVNEAITNLIYFTYEEGPGFTESCHDTTVVITDGGGIMYDTDGVADTIWRCTTEPSVLWVEAPGEVISDFNLEWFDEDDDVILGTDAYTTIIEGTEADTAHVTCYLTFGDCFGGITIANQYVIITIQTPEIYVPDPGLICEDSILLADIIVLDTADVEDVIIEYYEEYPDEVGDTGEWPSEYVFNGDTVYVLMANPIRGCYDVDTIFVVLNDINAGEDGVGPELCDSDGSSINLNDYLTGADPGGSWAVLPVSAEPGLSSVTGLFSPLNIPGGDYEFYYIVGLAPCPDDSATIFIKILEMYTAGLDGSIETCSAPGVTVDLNDLLDGNDPGGTWAEVTPTGSFNSLTGILDASDLELGVYTYTYTSLADGPCLPDEAVFTVIVEEGPSANFTFTPGSAYIDDTEVEFTSTSIGATSFIWNFGDGSPEVTDENPIHEFPAVADLYEVSLYVENDLGCPDSVTAYFKVKDIILFYIPNTFTPDGNEMNDRFLPVFESGFDPFDFHMAIYNRYGEIVFETYDATSGWDGAYGNKGLIQEGIYTWSIDFKELETDKRHQYSGHITVLK